MRFSIFLSVIGVTLAFLPRPFPRATVTYLGTGTALKSQAGRSQAGHYGGGAPSLDAPLAVIPTDEEMEVWLQDMIFSGDIKGFTRRRSREVVTIDFVEYVEERLQLSEDEDEKLALSEVFSEVSYRLKETEGLVDSGVVFERRLDTILFCAPSKRADLIKNNLIDDMTPSFIAYVQDELKATSDTDGKVVLASILQLIGQAKGGDYLGGAASLLSLADEKLGDQFKKNEGELSLSGGVTESKGASSVGDRNEQILAALLFSNNDILEDVLNNLHEIDDRFTKFLQDKVDKTRNIEERSGLQSLLDTINTVLERVKEAQGENQTNGVVDDELTMEQVKQRMQEVQMGTSIDNKTEGKKVNKAFTVQKEKMDSFKQILSRFTGLSDEQALEEAVQANYDLCDKDFMEMLKAEADACFVEGADAEGKQYQDLMSTITRVMAGRIATAQERLQLILSKSRLGVKAMESEVVAMVRKGEVDEALTLLMETNAQQAQNAGATQAANVLRTLLNRVMTERERNLPDEQRLLRALLRENDSEKRKELLYAAFKPSKVMANDDHNSLERADGPPLISPPAFINIARQFILNFGNVEKMDIMSKVNKIVDEAQIVATDLYGVGMTPQQQQQFMFEKQTVSVWDLANFEGSSRIFSLAAR